jgi:hypothetical protein
MMMSPGSMYSSSLSMVESTGAPACTNMITRLQGHGRKAQHIPESTHSEYTQIIRQHCSGPSHHRQADQQGGNRGARGGVRNQGHGGCCKWKERCILSTARTTSFCTQGGTAAMSLDHQLLVHGALQSSSYHSATCPALL